jgi:hypothetical protein
MILRNSAETKERKTKERKMKKGVL